MIFTLNLFQEGLDAETVFSMTTIAKVSKVKNAESSSL